MFCIFCLNLRVNQTVAAVGAERSGLSAAAALLASCTVFCSSDLNLRMRSTLTSGGKEGRSCNSMLKMQFERADGDFPDFHVQHHVKDVIYQRMDLRNGSWLLA